MIWKGDFDLPVQQCGCYLSMIILQCMRIDNTKQIPNQLFKIAFCSTKTESKKKKLGQKRPLDCLTV